MPKYKYQGYEYSEEEIISAAEQNNLSLEDYINKFELEVVSDEVETVDFQTDPAKETADVGSETPAVDTELASEVGSLDSPETNKPSTWQSIKNSFSNLGEQIGDVFEFWGSDEGAGAGLDIATHAVYEAIFGKENIDKFIEMAPKNIVIGGAVMPNFFTEGLSSKETIQAVEKFEKEKEEVKETKGIVESFKEGDAGGVFAGIVNGVTSGIGSVGYMIGTFGAGFAADYVADSYVEYNKLKAENEGKSLRQLIDEGEANNAVPVAMGAVMTGLERIGFGAISKGVMGAAKGASGKTLVGGLSKNIAEKVFYNKGARAAANIMSTGATEFTTEVLQNAAEEVNKELGRVSGTEDDAKVFTAFVDAVFSEDALEAGLQGAFGGGGMVAGSYSAKAMSTVRKTVSQVDVNEDLNKLADQRTKLQQAKTNEAKEGIQAEIDQIEMRLSDAVQKGNIIYESLSDEQISEVENLTDLADAAAYKATQLNKQLRRGEITEDTYSAAMQGFKTQYDQARQNLIDMKLDENIKLAQEQGKQKGIDVEVIETDKGFKDKIQEITGEELESKTAKGQRILTQGVYIGDGKILINKEVARETGAISVGTHELLHPILNTLVGDVKQQNKIVKEFRRSMTYDQRKVVDKLMKERGYTTPKQYATEYITTFSDALATGQINYEKNIFEKIGDAIVGVFKPLGYDNISFESGRDVYNFIKEYNKSIEEGVVSEKVTEAISDLDITKEQEVEIQESKKLAPEVSNTVAEQIKEINKLEQEGKAIAERVNKDFIKSAKQQRTESKLRELISPALDALAESTTKRLYDRIPDEQKRNVSRQVYKDSLKNDWVSKVINEYDAAKQDVETFLSTRGNLRANSLAKELGIESEKTGGIKADVTEQKALTTDDQTGERIDEGVETARLEAKLIDPTSLIQDEGLREKYVSIVKEKIKSLDLKNISFKTLKDLAPEVTAELFGIPVKKVTDAAANLATGDLSSIQNFINKNADKLLKLLPEGGIDQNQAASESLIGTSTGVARKLLDAFYDPKPRVTKGAGLAIQKKRKGITRREFLEAFGIVDGKKLEGLSPRSPEAQAMKGMVSLFGRMMTNTIVRQELSKDVTKELLVYNASPKSFDQLGERTGLIFLATDKREADAYADMNRGEVKDIYIDENTIASEKQALSVMKDLGIDTTQGNLYELIDPRFEEFYVGKKAVDQVTSVLANNGFKAIKYKDGGQVSKTTDSIVVFDKSAISDKKITKAIVQDIAAGKSELQFSRTLASEMSSEKGNVFWSSRNIKAFKDLIINDPENIGKHFKEVYGGVFNNEDKIANELDSEYKKWKKLDKDKKDNIEEHIVNFITSFGLRAGLRNILKLGDDSLNFRNKKQLENARKALRKLAENISEEDFMKYLLPTLQSGWGLIGGKFVAEKNSDGYILTEVNQDGSKSFRYHLVSGRNDAINILLKDTFENETSYIPRSTEAIINGKKIKTTKVPNQTANDFTSGKFEKDLNKRKDFAKDQRNGMLKISTTLQELLNNGSVSANDIGMILMTFASNTNALIRTAAIPENKFDGQFPENTEFVYEHSKPAREVLIQIADLIGNNKLNKKTYNNIMKDYVVTILPKVYDDIINKYYKDFSPIDKDGNYLKSTAKRPSRYFNDLVEAGIIAEGLPPLKLISLGTKPKRKVVIQPSQTLDKTARENKQKLLDKQFNDILENKTGIASEKIYSKAKAEVVGASKGKFNWFIPPTAEDFVGLLYQFLGKGKNGDLQMAWFKVNILNPYAKAMSKFTRDRVSTARNYRALKKQLKIVPKNLKKKIPGEDFTIEQALRVYLWTKLGYEIPGLSAEDAKPLRDFVKNNDQYKDFAEKLLLVNQDDYAKPKDGWLAGTITTDLLESLNEGRRTEYLKDWQENVDAIFSEDNLNKIEAAYGSKFRYALENSLTRMKTGRNRTYGTDSLTGRVVDWLTNSIGAIMFFNTRSAILQTLSSVNFINFSDNNVLAAGKAFANQKQYWSDFLKLFNSDFLIDRRDGLRLNVNESDIADMAKQGGVRGVVSEILKAGFLPTQMADSFAIASGGATFYRNRLKRYIKEGIDPKKAEEMAFMEFREIAEESQQSSRPDKISAQQAGPLGRIILAFANTPAQYARLMKKAASDLKNGRGDAKSNISKIIYYGVAQNLIFNAMQQALFAVAFGDEEEDEEEKKQKKAINIANGMADSVLRGMGISGAVFSVLKNTVKKLIERSEKKQPDYAENALMELLKISPPVSSKASKVKNALRSYEWDKDEMYEKGLALDNPAYLAAGNIVSAATNVPLDRAVKKVTNVKDATGEDLELWQRLALLGGWSAWELGVDKEEEKSSRAKTKYSKTKYNKTKY